MKLNSYIMILSVTNICIRKKYIARILCFAFLLIPLVSAAQLNTDVNEGQIDKIFSKWDQTGFPGCAVGVFHEGELLFSKGYGEAVLDSSEPITPQTVFYAGSVSKQFAAAAVVLLSLKGEIDLDRPVKDYIPEMPSYPDNPDPTVRQLIHHTSGIPDLYSLLSLYGVDLESVIPFEKMVEIITGQSHLNFEPGSDYLYSNSGYTLLAELVRVSGQTLREYTSEHLFEPLGMENTHFHDDRNHNFENKALSYQPKNDGEFELSYLQNFEGVGPGGLYTTVEDLLKWDQQLTRNHLSDADGFNELMHRRGILSNGDTLDYAFALQHDEYKGQKTVGHSGTFMGFKAHYWRIPDQQYGSALLCNLGDINPSDLNRELANLFMADLFKKYLSKYAGTYHSEDLDLNYTLQIKDNQLFLDREMSPSGTFRYANRHTFRSGGWEIEFRESTDGNIEGFEISSGRANEIYFEKEE